MAASPSSPIPPLPSGQREAFDGSGNVLPPEHELAAVQDGPAGGRPLFPQPRFVQEAEGLVRDRLTDLLWPEAGSLEFPAGWAEALARCAAWAEEGRHGRTDWRLPNRRELRSLVDHARHTPALPKDHPFAAIPSAWHWSATTSALAPAYAWRVHFLGGRMFYGAKGEDSLILPVAGTSTSLLATGQRRAYDADGVELAPDAPLARLQDGVLRQGLPWPLPRFQVLQGTDPASLRDRATGLVWTRSADLAGGYVTWDGALSLCLDLARETGRNWRLPTINELESLVDASNTHPAVARLANGALPFPDLGEAVWSATTSGYETDWAYCFYAAKGAVGVGYKAKPEFSVLAVRDDAAGDEA